MYFRACIKKYFPLSDFGKLFTEETARRILDETKENREAEAKVPVLRRGQY